MEPSCHRSCTPVLRQMKAPKYKRPASFLLFQFPMQVLWQSNALLKGTERNHLAFESLHSKRDHCWRVSPALLSYSRFSHFGLPHPASLFIISISLALPLLKVHQFHEVNSCSFVLSVMGKRLEQLMTGNLGWCRNSYNRNRVESYYFILCWLYTCDETF